MQPIARLPIAFDRKFRPWRYQLSHSELSLRSFGPDSADDFIQITFYGVLGVKLKTVYPRLELARAQDDQVREILEVAGLGLERAPDVIALALKSSGPDGLVACMSYTVRSCPRELSDDAYVASAQEWTVIARG
ncbi:hypothetical protein H4696_004460 [Amycolatopsis lexingtonensis]|uniref:Uncharacterized protein n=1 Tax=Amycolatopsis lexingtonensis TaxID=218822 RepID=A0ABR9I2I4_9PSEU|nr:hypothetical protein [Amycolatopsis lexingtonensis]MBE1497360.1 hypothetical protein [Amycolatopsis lexingtonensis]